MPTFDSPTPISATFDVFLGDVRISATDRADTVVEVHPSDATNEDDRQAAELTRVDYADGGLLIKAPKPRSWVSRNGGGSIEVTIALPSGSRVQGSADAADVYGEGRLGECRIKTGLGDIRLEQAATLTLKTGKGDVVVEHATGDAEVEAGSGDVRLRTLDGKSIVKNSNGATWVGVAGGDTRLSAANGSIAVDLARGSVVAKSANGDVRVNEAVRGSLVLETALGDLEVGI